MRCSRSYAAFGVALAIGAPAADAQTIITTQPLYNVAAPPLLAAPAPAVLPAAETIETIRTVRTVRTVPVRRPIVTTRTITRRVVPAAPAMVAGPTPVAPQPLYDEGPAPVPTPAADIAPAPAYDYSYAPAPAYDYATPLYDTAPPAVAPAPIVAAPAVAPPAVVAAPVVATQPILYRYVYEPDRILVIDPVTNIAVQAIPR
jgi:hypothetical protein